MPVEKVKDIIARIERLEAAVFPANARRAVTKNTAGAYTGITGSIRRLAEQEQFFDQGRVLGEVKKELEGNGYHSSLQAVQVALKRLARPGGPLISYKDGAKKKYAKRK